MDAEAQRLADQAHAFAHFFLYAVRVVGILAVVYASWLALLGQEVDGGPWGYAVIGLICVAVTYREEAGSDA